jgi:ribonuclease BN (tRNA processing enzyme)
MELVLLGTGGYHPNETRHTACLMLPEQGILLDAGTALFRARQYLQTSDLTIFLTHAHLDHIVGLTFLFDVLEDRQTQRAVVFGDPAKCAAIQSRLLDEPFFPASLPVEFRPLPGDMPLAGNGRLRSFPLEHPGGSIGLRLDWPGHSLAYVTDTSAKPGAAYLEHIRGVDLLVHECYFPDGHEQIAETTGHSCLSAVARLAKEAGVGRLVLVHFDPRSERLDEFDLQAARTIFTATQFGQDQMRLDF